MIADDDDVGIFEKRLPDTDVSYVLSILLEGLQGHCAMRNRMLGAFFLEKNYVVLGTCVKKNICKLTMLLLCGE